MSAASKACTKASSSSPAQAGEATETYEVDKANVEWIDNILKGHPQSSANDLVNKVISRVIAEATADIAGNAAKRSFIFEKVRGANRKKQKHSIQLSLTSENSQFLTQMMKVHDIPSLGKALRIVLDWALEEKLEAIAWKDKFMLEPGAQEHLPRGATKDAPPVGGLADVTGAPRSLPPPLASWTVDKGTGL